jgi:hypothetical protein
MGWKLKLIALLIAIVAMAYNAWIISIPIFAYLLLSISWRRSSSTSEIPKKVKIERASRKLCKRHILGSLFLILSFLATMLAGIFSPIAFASIGLLLIFWKRIIDLPIFLSIKPVNESILMQRSLLPFYWFAMVEVKLLSKLDRALSGVSESILIIASEKPSIHLLFSAIALSEKSAERKVLNRIEEAVDVLAPMGAYLLPLDSKQTESILCISIQSLKFDPDDPLPSLSTLPFDALVIKPDKGFVGSIGVYKKIEKSGEIKTTLLPPQYNMKRTPLLWEVFKSIENRIQFSNPDRYTSFLTSMFATRGEALGERLVDDGASVSSQALSIQSLNTFFVELSRAQLRAIVKTYT